MKKIYVNASALKKTYCDQAYHFTCVDGLVPTDRVEPLNFGIATHKFAQLLAGKDFAKEFGPALKAAKEIYTGPNIETLVETCKQLCTLPVQKPFENLVEFFFEAPYKKTENYNLVLCGTVDQISFVNGRIKIYDYKTSRAYNKEETVANYGISTQMIFYARFMYCHPEVFSQDPEFIAAAKANKIDVHILLGAITEETAKRPRSVRWSICAPFSFSLAQYCEYNALLDLYTTAILEAQDVEVPLRNGWISELCSDCDFKQICHASKEDKDLVIKYKYKVKPYDPRH